MKKHYNLSFSNLFAAMGIFVVAAIAVIAEVAAFQEAFDAGDD